MWLTALLPVLFLLAHASGSAIPFLVSRNNDTSVVNTTEIESMAQRRRADLATFPDPAWFPQIDTWLASQKDGVWDDVDYTSGCSAQRANWPIQFHWTRLLTFAAAWSGLNPSVPQNYSNSPELLSAVQAGLDFWAANDYNSTDCIGHGGVANYSCPCGTPGLWNTNWYGQTILLPQLVAPTCLLVSTSGNLTDSQMSLCSRIPERGYRYNELTPGSDPMTGANMVNIMLNSMTWALYSGNETILRDAMTQSMGAVVFSDNTTEDGIHRDGSFLQHEGVLYNGNYGKDLLNAFIALEGPAIGTQYAASNDSRAALSTQVKGSEWMIYVDQETKQEHWDFNVIGRFVAFPTTDLIQATSDILFNATKLAAATFDFADEYSVADTVQRLNSNGSDPLVGNKVFWASDYVSHRRENYIIGSKMLSTRSLGTETANSANTLGHWLGQGTLFSYVSGNEYKDIQAEWDWQLVPGVTSLLSDDNGGVNLTLNNIGPPGKKSWVGGVSDGSLGVVVMDWEDVRNASWGYKKAWFYVEEGVIVTVGDVFNDGSAEGQVITALTQRASTDSEIYVDGASFDSNNDSTSAHTLFYEDTGYVAYDTAFNLKITNGEKKGNWSAISTSTRGEASTSIFSAYTSHGDLAVAAGSNQTWSYGMFPASSKKKVQKEHKHQSYHPFQNDGVWGIHGHDTLGLVFWPGSSLAFGSEVATAFGGYPNGWVNITSSEPVVLLMTTSEDGTMNINIADPSQTVQSLDLTFQFDDGARLDCVDEDCEVDGDVVRFTGVQLPAGGWAGDSVSLKTKWA
ncbi:hypothetical protein B9479_006010 [Cryptococcus floricola]|uniref:Polysaccharide lyase family 8 protein n=1 Tax=Cryptococcus floricola TaxID=2591691 RepID=A0A5D3ATF0_9TREE|nr:hypothetical protein B9479_006010 [Cryptococcus floricola]